MGFSAACQNQSQEPTLFLILISRVIWAKSMWCGGHVWHLAVRVGELVWLHTMPFVCRFVDLSEVADPAHWSWLSPTTDFRQGRKAFLMTPPEFWLTYIACVYLDGLLQGLRFKFFGARWNPSTIKSWCWGFSFLKIKVAVLALLDFPRFVWEILKKTDLEGRDLPLIFGQSLVGH